MPWIESHTSLARHPKTIRLAKALDCSVPCAIGHLHLLWWWSLEYAAEGDLSEYAPEEIAAAGCYDGDPDDFLTALKRARFINEDGQLHDWQDYAGRLIEKRRVDADRLRRWRDGKRGENADETPPPSFNSADETQTKRVSYDVPYLTVPNRTVPTVPNRGDERAADADAPPAAPAEEPKRTRTPRVTTVDEGCILALVAKFADALTEEDVRESVKTALAHKSRERYTDLQQYVRNWVRNDANNHPSRELSHGRLSTSGRGATLNGVHPDDLELDRDWVGLQARTAGNRRDPGECPGGLAAGDHDALPGVWGAGGDCDSAAAERDTVRTPVPTLPLPGRSRAYALGHGGQHPAALSRAHVLQLPPATRRGPGRARSSQALVRGRRYRFPDPLWQPQPHEDGASDQRVSPADLTGATWLVSEGARSPSRHPRELRPDGRRSAFLGDHGGRADGAPVGAGRSRSRAIAEGYELAGGHAVPSDRPSARLSAADVGDDQSGRANGQAVHGARQPDRAAHPVAAAGDGGGPRDPGRGGESTGSVALNRGTERPIPHALEAEQAVLGACLIDPEAIGAIAEQLTPDDFWIARHRMIFAAMASLADRRIPPDFLMLCDELTRTGELEGVGGERYLAELLGVVPTSLHVVYYAGIVARLAHLRRLIRAGTAIADLGYQDTEDLEATLASADTLLGKVTRTGKAASWAPVGESVLAYLASISALEGTETSRAAASTGYADLDRLLGGLYGGDLVILAARPGFGKTSLALGMASHIALKLGGNVGLFSLEMSHLQVAGRLLAGMADIDVARLREGRVGAAELARISEAQSKLMTAPLWVDGTSNLALRELEIRARRLHAEHPLSLLTVDYLQLVHAPGDNRVQSIGAISRSLKGLAGELQCPVLALSQLSRAVEHRSPHTPLLSDLRESGDLEQDADVVMFIYREDQYDRDTELKGVAEIIVAKQRNGPTGIINLLFLDRNARFVSLGVS